MQIYLSTTTLGRMTFSKLTLGRKILTGKNLGKTNLLQPHSQSKMSTKQFKDFIIITLLSLQTYLVIRKQKINHNRVCTIKLFTAVINSLLQQARVFFHSHSNIGMQRTQVEPVQGLYCKILRIRNLQKNDQCRSKLVYFGLDEHTSLLQSLKLRIRNVFIVQASRLHSKGMLLALLTNIRVGLK